MSSPMTVGGNQSPGSRNRANTPRESINSSFPSGSILAEPTDTPLKRGQIAQALIDGLCVIFGFFFLCTAMASLPLAVVVMFLVR